MKIKIVTHKENAGLIKTLRIETDVNEVEEFAKRKESQPIYKSLIRLLERVAGKDKDA